MRIELVISAAVHTVVLVASAVALPSAEAYKIKEPPPLPVELFTVDEFTQLAGKKTEKEPIVNAPAVEKAPEPIEIPKPTPPKAVEAEPTPPPQKVAAVEPPPEPAPPEPIEVLPPEPLPLPEPVVKTQPEKVPLPEPVAAPEPAPEPVPEPEPAPEPEPEVVKAPPPTSTAPTPQRKPKPPKSAKASAKKKPAKKKPTFNADKIAALLNKVQDDDAGPKPVAAAGRAEDGRSDVSGLDLVVTQSEMRYLQNQMQRCWNPPVAVANAASLNVKVEVRFKRNGQLEAKPVVINSGGEGFEVAANAAVRAVQQCQPYDLPAEKYDNWHQVIVNFDPQFMLGG